MKLAIFIFFISTQVFASFEGTLQFDLPINYKRFFCDKTAIPGDYLVKVKHASRSLKLKFKDVEGTRHSIKIKLPRHALPDHGGSITLTPGQTGQEFGIRANLSSKQIRREERTIRESCSIRVRVRRCQTDENGRRRCRDTYENRPGRQYVRYLVTTFQKDLDINLIDQEYEVFGKTETRDITSRSDVLYRSNCQRAP